MANVQINLQAVTQQFVTSMQQASTLMNQVVGNLGTLNTQLTQTQKQFTQTGQQAQQAASSISRAGAAAKQSEGFFTGLGNGAAFAAGKFLVLLRFAETIGEAFVAPFKDAITNIDQFNIAAIGTASAITNLSAEGVRFGRTYQDIFKQNLAATKGAFTELETISANFFASSKDLQLAYFTLAQRGVVIRREEFTLLGKTVDQILLLTQGQNTAIQVQEELRNLIAGTLRPTSQLVQLIKAFGGDVKQISADIKATQSLKPLEPILKGAIEATTEVQKTFLAAKNSFDSFFNQVRRSGFDEFFVRINQGIIKFVEFLRAHQDQISGFINIFGGHAAGIIEGFLETAKKVIETISGPKGIDPSNPIVIFAAAISAFIQNIPRLIQVFIAFIEVLLKLPEIFDKAFGDDTKKNIAETGKEIAKTGQELTKAAKQASDFESRVNAADPGFAKFGKPNRDKPVDVTTLPGQAAGVAGSAVASATGLDKLTVAMKLMRAEFAEATKGVSKFVTVQDELKNIVAQNARGIEKSAKDRQQALDAPLNFPIDPPTTVSPEEEKAEKQRSKSLLALQLRLARTRREEELSDIRRSGRALLDELRRQEALLQQGFIIDQTGKTLDLTSDLFQIRPGVIAKLDQQLAQIKKEFTDFEVEAREEFEASSAIHADVLIADAKKIVADSQITLTETLNKAAVAVNEADKRVQRLEALKSGQVKPADVQTEIGKNLVDIQRIKNAQAELAQESEQAAKRVADAVVQGQREQLDFVQNFKGPGGFPSDDVRAQKTFEIAERVRLAEEAKNKLSERGLRLQEELAAAEGRQTSLQTEQLGIAKNGLDVEIQTAEKRRDQVSLQAEATQLKANADHGRQVEVARQTESLGLAERALLKEKEIQSVMVERTKLRLEENRNVAERNALDARGRQALEKAREGVVAEKDSLKKEFQTPVEQELNAIQKAFSDIIRSFAQVTIPLEQKRAELEAKLTEVQTKNRPSDAELDPNFIGPHFPDLVRENELISQINEIDDTLGELSDEIEKTTVSLKGHKEAVAENRDLIEGSRSAFKGAFDGLVTALTDSFEGKRTDFARLGKTLADNIVKANFEALGKQISTSMSTILGPAFSLGFALIASFVLGQLLNKNKGSSTSANAKVGIQSSEQVRGLIGGETSIPIGQIGESLQSAFVPTNALLTRIAFGVERLGTIGINVDTAALQDTLTHAFGSALQVQASTV